MLTSDSFAVIGTALIQTGNTPPAVASDGTDEWIAGWNAYQLWLPYCLEARDWQFQTTVGDLVRLGPSPLPRFQDSYALPPNCIHLCTVWRSDFAAQQIVYQGYGMTRDGIRPPQIEYKLQGNAVQTTAPNGLTGEWLTSQSGDDKYSATFIVALTAFVAASIYAALNEDLPAAEQTAKHAEALLQTASTRAAQQENRQVAFRSRMIERRRARYAPWGSVYGLPLVLMLEGARMLVNHLAG